MKRKEILKKKKKLSDEITDLINLRGTDKDDEKLNYHNLEEVHNGSEAMSAFANMGKLSTKDREKLRHNLLKYCELDTYAMVKIWKKLKDIK